MQPTIWVKADICPRLAREELISLAERLGCEVWFILSHARSWVDSLRSLRFVHVFYGDVCPLIGPDDVWLESFQADYSLADAEHLRDELSGLVG